MTVLLLISIAVLAAAVIFLGLALMGATRTVERLRRDLDDQAGTDLVHHETGLSVGSPTPPLAGVDASGRPADTSALSGRRHMVVFAEPGCRACEALVPELLRGEAHMPLALVGRSTVGWPEAWRPSAAEVQIVFDPEETIGDAFAVGFTPWIFVVDEGGSVAAQGSAETIDAVRALMREAETLQIVPTEVSRGARA